MIRYKNTYILTILNGSEDQRTRVWSPAALVKDYPISFRITAPLVYGLAHQKQPKTNVFQAFVHKKTLISFYSFQVIRCKKINSWATCFAVKPTTKQMSHKSNETWRNIIFEKFQLIRGKTQFQQNLTNANSWSQWDTTLHSSSWSCAHRKHRKSSQCTALARCLFMDLLKTLSHSKHQ